MILFCSNFLIFHFAHLNADLWGFARDVVQREDPNIITVCPQNTQMLYTTITENQGIGQKHLFQLRNTSTKIKTNFLADKCYSVLLAIIPSIMSRDCAPMIRKQIRSKIFPLILKLQYKSIRSTLMGFKRSILDWHLA